MNISKLKEIITNFRNKKILIIGDIMLDEYIWGEIMRISPEAPVPIVKVIKRSYALGGAGNTAANVAALGGNPVLTGAIGKDQQAVILIEELKKLQISTNYMISHNHPTITKTRIIAQDQQIIRIDVEQLDQLNVALENKILRIALEQIEYVQACVISDYAKNIITDRVSKEIISTARQFGVPIIVDPKGSYFLKYRNATVVTPNIKEVEKFYNHDITNEHEILHFAGKLKNLLHDSAILITRGPEGMTLYLNESEIYNIISVARHLYDVTGAGDTVVSVFALSLASGATLKQAAYIANHAAGLVVEKIGTATVSFEELLARINEK